MSTTREFLHNPGTMKVIAKGESDDWIPERIAYLKVGFTGPVQSRTYSYVGTPGYHLIPEGADPYAVLNNFLASICKSPPDPGTPVESIPVGQPPHQLDFQLKYSSFIVFQLDPTLNWQFSYAADPVTTNDTTSGEYFSLIQMFDDATEAPAPGATQPIADATPPNSPCHIAYFSAPSPSSWGRQGLSDGFNLNIFFPGSGPGTGDQYIDPEIKNTGHNGSSVPRQKSGGTVKSAPAI